MGLVREATIMIRGKTDADAMLNRVQGATANLTSTLGSLGFAMGGTAIAYGIKNMITGIVEAGDQLDALSQRTGATIEWLSAMGHVAEQNKTSITSFNTSFKSMAKILYDAQSGLAESKRAFTDIGIDIDDLAGKKPEEVFMQIVDAISKIQDPLRQAAIAQRMFGRSGTEMLPMIKQGTDAIRDQIGEAHRLHGVFSEDLAKSSALLLDNLSALGYTFDGISRTLAGGFIEDLTDITSLMRSIANQIDDYEVLGEVFGYISKLQESPLVSQLLKIVSIPKDMLTKPLGWIGMAAGAYGDYTKGAYQPEDGPMYGPELPSTPPMVAPNAGKSAVKRQKEIYQGSMDLATEGFRLQSELDSLRYEDLFTEERAFSDRRIEDVQQWGALTLDTQGLIYENRKALDEIQNEEDRQRIADFAQYTSQMLSIPVATFGNMMAKAIVDNEANFEEMWKAALRGAIALTMQMVTMLVIAKAIKITLGSIGGPMGQFFSTTADMMGMREGGLIPMARYGMHVSEPQDIVPIYAHRGEFIMRKETVNSIGAGNMAAMNMTGQLPDNDGSTGASIQIIVNPPAHANPRETAYAIRDELQTMFNAGELRIPA